MVSRLLLVRREGFEPQAFWSVGCLKGKSESFRLRFVLFATVRSADFPLFPSSPACSNSILGQNWVRSCREDKRRYRSRQKNLPQIPKNEKAFAPHVRVRCIILSYRKRAKTRAELSTRATPMTFQAEISTFRAVDRTNREKYAILSALTCKPLRGTPPGPVGVSLTGYHSARGR